MKGELKKVYEERRGEALGEVGRIRSDMVVQGFRRRAEGMGEVSEKTKE